MVADRWRKATFSHQVSDCVELAPHGAVRDSKNPAGPVLAVDLGPLLAAVKTGRIG
jgi:Domain of unknown function (DUF397)